MINSLESSSPKNYVQNYDSRTTINSRVIKAEHAETGLVLQENAEKKIKELRISTIQRRYRTIASVNLNFLFLEKNLCFSAYKPQKNQTKIFDSDCQFLGSKTTTKTGHGRRKCQIQRPRFLYYLTISS